jgi:hypothetical protein
VVERDIPSADDDRFENAAPYNLAPSARRRAGIVLLLPWIIMRSPVELNDQPMFDAEEIHNVFSDGNLTPELQAHERAATQSAP